MSHKIKNFVIILIIFLTGCSNSGSNLHNSATALKIGIDPSLAWLEIYIHKCLIQNPEVQILRSYGDNQNDDQLDLIFTSNIENSEHEYDNTYILGYDHIVFIVHPDNPLTELSMGQIQAIFAGDIQVWPMIESEYKFDIDKINIYVLPNQSKEQLFILGFINFSGTKRLNYKTVPNFFEIKTIVSNSPDAIGYLPIHLLDESIKSISIRDADNSLLQYPIIFASQKIPKGKQIELINCLQEELMD